MRMRMMVWSYGSRVSTSSGARQWYSLQTRVGEALYALVPALQRLRLVTPLCGVTSLLALCATDRDLAQSAVGCVTPQSGAASGLLGYIHLGPIPRQQRVHGLHRPDAAFDPLDGAGPLGQPDAGEARTAPFWDLGQNENLW